MGLQTPFMVKTTRRPQKISKSARRKYVFPFRPEVRLKMEPAVQILRSLRCWENNAFTMGTWPALEVTDIKTAITPKSGLTAGSACPGG